MQLVIDTLTFFFDRGESKLLQKGPLIGSAWKDNKILTVLSTTSQPAASGTVLRRQKDGTREPVSCPDNIIHYNKYMGGVDRGDQLRGYYLCRTKSRKFYKYIFYFLFDVAVTNAYILYKHFHSHPSKSLLSVKDFRLQLAKELIGSYCSRRVPGRSGGVVRPLQLQHFPLKECLETTEKRSRRGRCSYCSNHHSKRSDTCWRCRECKVWLCHDGNPQTDCFFLWHKRL